MNLLTVYIHKASDINFEEHHLIEMKDFTMFLLNLKEEYGCGRFELLFDPLFQDEEDIVNVCIYDSYIE